MMEYLKNLCALEGVSGRENAVRDYICQTLAIHSAVVEMTVNCDALGNVIVRLKGEKRAARNVLFAAHMDEVGFIITGITDEGYLRFTTVGGVNVRVVYGRRVRVNGHIGIIGGKAIHLCKGDEKKTAPAMDKLLIDIGADSREDALNRVQPGDVAVFDSEYVELESGLFKARALDDRVGCALMLKLTESTPKYDITLAFTVQEEIGLRGAKTAAYEIQPDIAVVIDATTAADTVGVVEEKQVCCVRGGPVVSFMDGRTLYDKPLYDSIRALADSLGIKSQTKSMVAGGNDAGSIQLAGIGARVAAVSLPCRYIHSPSCVLSEQDVNDTFTLLSALAERLGEESF